MFDRFISIVGEIIGALGVPCTFIYTILSRYHDKKYQDAGLFSVWGERGRVAIQNGSHGPMYDVQIISVSRMSTQDLRDESEAFLALQTEECVFPLSGTDESAPRIRIAFVPPGLHHAPMPQGDGRQAHHAYYEIIFRDVSNRWWRRRGGGLLEPLGNEEKELYLSSRSYPRRNSELLD